MARIVADRVLETSTTTGTGSYTLAGAVLGYRAASAVCANGDTITYYAEATNVNGVANGEWEIGLGTWGTGNILARTTIYASSNANAAVSWGTGTRRIGLGLISNPSLGNTTVVGTLDVNGTTTLAGQLNLPASTTTVVPLHIANGVKKTTPVAGDVWNQTEGLMFQNANNLIQLDVDANSAGCLTEPAITITGSGATLNAGSVAAFLFSASGWQGDFRKYIVPAATSLALTDHSANYLVVSYNSGSPEYSITTNPATINNSSIVGAALLWREGTEVHFQPINWGLATANRLNRRAVQTERYLRASGLLLGESTGRIITLTAGNIWYGVTEYVEGAVTSASSNCDFYYNVAGVWTKSVVSTYNNTQYDNGTNLVALSGGGTRYAVNWVYRYIDGSGLPKLAYILGSGSYNIGQAQASSAPTPPTILTGIAILVGRVIVALNAATATEINSAFTTVFAGTTVVDHNDLANIQGGTTLEYYHLTSAEYIGNGTGLPVRTTSPALVTPSLGVASATSLAITGTAGAGFQTFVGQSSNPPAPAAGTLLVHSKTVNGFTRLEQDNESATNVVYGRDNVFIAKNPTGSTIPKGSTVYVSGVASGAPEVQLARANSSATLPCAGITVDAITGGGFGQVMYAGLLTFDTTAFSTGNQVWVSTSTAGALTATRPSGTTNSVQRMGTILVQGNSTTGLMLVQTAPAVLNMETGTNATTWTGKNLSLTGDASATTFNKVTITAPASGATLTLADGSTLSASGSASVSGTNTGDNATNTQYSGLVSNATHTGDVTGSTALTIAAGAVTYAKIQNVSATSRVLGRITAGAGSAEELTGANLATIIGITNTAANVTGVTGTAPVVSSGGTAPAISMAAASSGVNGYMTGTYATKLDGIAAGATTCVGTVTGVTGTAPVVSSGGTAPVISMAAANTTTSGYLTSTDWNTFNGKQAAGTYATGTGTASGTNTGDNAVNTLYSGLVSNATHTGDVTGSAALTIAAGVVTYAKIQNVSATSRVLGRITAGAGSAEELTGANLATIIGITNTAANVNSVNGITGAVTAANISAAATTGYGFTPYSNANPSGYTTCVGTVTSVGGTGTVSGLTLTGSVTGSGNLTLGGAIGTLNQNTTGSAGSATWASCTCGNAASATLASTLTNNSSTSASNYPIAWWSGTSLYSTPAGLCVYPSTCGMYIAGCIWTSTCVVAPGFCGRLTGCADCSYCSCCALYAYCTCGNVTGSANYATYSSYLCSLDAPTSYKLGYNASGARTHPGIWGRAVMIYDGNGQSYGIQVDCADWAGCTCGNVTGSSATTGCATCAYYAIYAGNMCPGTNINGSNICATTCFCGPYYNASGYFYGPTVYATSCLCSCGVLQGLSHIYTSGGNICSACCINSAGQIGSSSCVVALGYLYTSNWVCAASGVCTAGNVVAYNASDCNLKEKITVITCALAKVQQLRGVEYDWNEVGIRLNGGIPTDDGKTGFFNIHDVGVIAQEVERVMPEAVRNKEDGYKGVRYEKLIPLLIEAIKEQQVEIELLQARI